MSLIKKLALTLKIEEENVIEFLRNAPQKYKVYRIPKRTYGYRIIAHPSKELKKYQYAFLSLMDFPYHSQAMAYIEGRSIKDNADIHRFNPYLLKLDFKNFFNSITPNSFWEIIKKLNECEILNVDQKNTIFWLFNLTETEKRLAEKILFWSKSRTVDKHLMLSIGAPTSPAISNMYMYLFDVILFDLCSTQKISYSRYADDLFLSTKIENVLFDYPKKINDILIREYSANIKLNEEKTIFTSKAHSRFITGISINNENNLSLGRKKKRYIKHLIHQFLLQKLGIDDVRHLNGLLSYGKYIDPFFMQSLKNKYGGNILQLIKEATNYEKRT